MIPPVIQRLERERKLLLSALGPADRLQQMFREARRNQQLIRDTLGRSDNFARLLVDANRMRREFDRALELRDQWARLATEASQAQRAIKGLHASSSSFAELANTLGSQRRMLDQALGPFAREHLASSIAISRSLTLSPQLSSTAAALFDNLALAKPDGTAFIDPRQDAAWSSTLDEVIDALEQSFEQTDEKIDRRALLRFAGWLLTFLLAVYSVWLAETSSDNMQAGFDGVESTAEMHQLQVRREHDDIAAAQDEAIDRINSRLDAVIERFEGQLEEDDAAAFYIVVRAVPMTEERRYHGAQIVWLMPGQEVEVIERSKKWLRVIAYDLESEDIHAGWVLKKYLKRVAGP